MAAHEYLTITVPQPGRRQIIMVILVAMVCWATSSPVVPTWFGAVALTLGWLAYSVLFANQQIQHAAAELVATVYIGVPLGMLVAGQLLAGWGGPPGLPGGGGGGEPARDDTR